MSPLTETSTSPSTTCRSYCVVVYPCIHCSMGSAPVGVQCFLTSSLGEFPGYYDWLWYPGLSPMLVSIALPFAFHISVFSTHSSSLAIGFHSSIFNVDGICTPPPTLLLYLGFHKHKLAKNSKTLPGHLELAGWPHAVRGLDSIDVIDCKLYRVSSMDVSVSLVHNFLYTDIIRTSAKVSRNYCSYFSS